ncbi:hypothetical protein EVAR_4150_1 [Eumeta japonica]|uniref:Uncharacterized protein n=1 Tax=Eumeta variegata TaxID=151549 RepID=A0A4C1TGY4_EUMVA|nr:hypothetical protein EVAR_4150_1 [Eumeta japonica]
MKIKYEPGAISVRNEESELVIATVFLGITLDNMLQWGPPINKFDRRQLKSHIRFGVQSCDILFSWLHRLRILFRTDMLLGTGEEYSEPFCQALDIHHGFCTKKR